MRSIARSAFFVLEAFENSQNFRFADGQTLERFRVVLDDQIGNFRLSGIPRGKHELRVKELGASG